MKYLFFIKVQNQKTLLFLGETVACYRNYVLLRKDLNIKGAIWKNLLKVLKVNSKYQQKGAAVY